MRTFGLIRTARRMSLQRVAILTGYSESHLRAVERGRAPLTQMLAAALARAYDVDISTLVRPAY